MPEPIDVTFDTEAPSETPKADYLNTRNRAAILLATQLPAEEVLDLLQEEGIGPDDARRALDFLASDMPEVIDDKMDRFLRGLLFQQAFRSGDTNAAMRVLDSIKTKVNTGNVSGTVHLELSIAEDPHNAT